MLQSQLAHLRTTPIHHRYDTDTSRLHGTLLLFRYLHTDIAWHTYASYGERVTCAWRTWVQDMHDTVWEIARVTIQVHNVGEMEEANKEESDGKRKS